MISVGILAPGAVLRRGLAAVLGERPDIEVRFASAWIDTDLAAASCQVLVLDTSNADSLEAWLDHAFGMQEPPALLFIGSVDQGVVDRVESEEIPWGALPEHSSDAAVYAAVLGVREGLVVVHPDLSASGSLDRAGTPAEMPEGTEPLTDREIEVLQLLGDGFSNKKIALHLSISEHTVKFHVSSIYGKLAAGNRAEAVRIGLQLGHISL